MEKLLYICIEYINIYVQLKFGKGPSSIKEVITMYPILHVPHPLCAPSKSSRYWYYSLNTWPCTWSHMLTMWPYYKTCVKMSKRYQVVKKMSNVKKSNTWTMEVVHKKIINWHNEVHTYWCQFWCHIWWWQKNPSKWALKVFMKNFGDLHIWCQNWCQYVWTSLCQVIIFLWTSSIVCVFDFLTFDFVLQFNIFLTFWHLF